MNADDACVVLVAEPAPLFADIIVGALNAAGHQALRSTTTPSALAVETVEVGAAVLVVGPSFGRAGLATVVPELLARGVRTVLIAPAGMDRVEAQLMLAGASGFLSAATGDYADIAAEVDRVAGESSPLHPNVVRAMLRQWRESRVAATTADRAVELTPREIDVVRGLRDGLTNRLIAARLGLSEKTVEAHKSRLFAKLGAKNASQALTLVSAQRLA